MRTHFSIIGDIHSRYDIYFRFTSLCNYSLQLGDLAFDYDPINKLNDEFHRRHVFLPGNHDNYTTQEDVFTHLPPNFIGHFGTYKIPEVTDSELSGNIFYVRGADSVDQKQRLIGIDWWPEEELSNADLYQAIDLYAKTKPDFVVTHTCPLSVIDKLHLPYSGGEVYKTKTAIALERMLEMHRPKIWVFGHFHQKWNEEIDGTKFFCVDQFDKLDFDNQLKVI